MPPILYRCHTCREKKELYSVFRSKLRELFFCMLHDVTLASKFCSIVVATSKNKFRSSQLILKVHVDLMYKILTLVNT